MKLLLIRLTEETLSNALEYAGSGGESSAMEYVFDVAREEVISQGLSVDEALLSDAISIAYEDGKEFIEVLVGELPDAPKSPTDDDRDAELEYQRQLALAYEEAKDQVGEVVEYNRGFCEINKHGNWRDEAAKSVEWAKDVKIRDGNQCQRRGCDNTTKLNAHHMDNAKDYRDKKFDVDNGITLCERCHIGFHQEYGYRGTTEKDTKEFVQVPYN